MGVRQKKVSRETRAVARAHQHTECSRCGADGELQTDVLEPLAEELKRRLGFETDLAHSAVVGVCRGCAHPEV